MIANIMKKVLIIEDYSTIRTLLINLLELKGYQGIEAANGREGLELAIKYKPDLIISDLHMPNKSGISLLRNIKERGLTVPVIVLSSDDSTDAQLEILKMGAHAIVAKTSDPRILFAWIYRLIGVSRSPESLVV